MITFMLNILIERCKILKIYLFIIFPTKNMNWRNKCLEIAAWTFARFFWFIPVFISLKPHWNGYNEMKSFTHRKSVCEGFNSNFIICLGHLKVILLPFSSNNWTNHLAHWILYFSGFFCSFIVWLIISMLSISSWYSLGGFSSCVVYSFFLNIQLSSIPWDPNFFLCTS